MYVEALGGRNFIRTPSFIRPPTPRRVYSVAGVCIRFGPVKQPLQDLFLVCFFTSASRRLSVTMHPPVLLTSGFLA